MVNSGTRLRLPRRNNPGLSACVDNQRSYIGLRICSRSSSDACERKLVQHTSYFHFECEMWFWSFDSQHAADLMLEILL
uniref:Uncharacterized protein n=1 Tax=Mesocestoides corti TaxID=53468 RepID=A0A5K3EU79_MESCO